VIQLENAAPGNRAVVAPRGLPCLALAAEVGSSRDPTTH
jgi:hypothetical protein